MLWWGLTLFEICPFRPFETAGTVGVVVCRIHDGLCGFVGAIQFMVCPDLSGGKCIQVEFLCYLRGSGGDDFLLLLFTIIKTSFSAFAKGVWTG